MKTLLFAAALTLVSTFAHAEDVLLDCRLTEKDIARVQVTQTDDGLYLHQISKSGTHTVSDLSERQWKSRHIRLANAAQGFRYLEYTDGFDQLDWYITVRGPSYQSIARANCK